MPVIAAVILYVVRLVRRPIDARLKKRQAGPIAIVGGLGLVVVAWLRFAPESIGLPYLTGELWGVAAVYLMTGALVLATKARWLERWFGGLDRMYWWHRWMASVAVGLLIVPHAYLTTVAPALEAGAPPGLVGAIGLVFGAISLVGLLALVGVSFPAIADALKLRYARWLSLHRLTGLFVIIAVVHGLAIDDVIANSSILWLLFVAMGVAALIAYAYAELLMRHLVPTTPGVVSSVERLSPDTVEVVLRCERPMPVTPGQFVSIKFAGSDWHEHPFSVAGELPHRRIRFVIKAVGHETKRIHAELEPGTRATLSGPYGCFDHTLGCDRQVWIAGGVGIAPFLGWLVAPDNTLPPRVDIFYVTSSGATAFYAEELDDVARDAPQLRVHHVRTSESGRLTLNQITDDAELDWTHLGPTDVFLCGPRPMIRALTRDLRHMGLPRERIHYELFAFR